MRRRLLAIAVAVVGFTGLGVATAGTASALTLDEFIDRVSITWSKGWDSQKLDTGVIKLADDPAVVAGVCRIYEGKITVYSCVPLQSPGGGTAIRALEDSSARYTDGYVIDAEDNTFHRG